MDGPDGLPFDGLGVARCDALQVAHVGVEVFGHLAIPDPAVRAFVLRTLNLDQTKPFNVRAKSDEELLTSCGMMVCLSLYCLGRAPV